MYWLMNESSITQINTLLTPLYNEVACCFIRGGFPLFFPVINGGQWGAAKTITITFASRGASYEK